MLIESVVVSLPFRSPFAASLNKTKVQKAEVLSKALPAFTATGVKKERFPAVFILFVIG
jgi:hypothetical protein